MWITRARALDRFFLRTNVSLPASYMTDVSLEPDEDEDRCFLCIWGRGGLPSKLSIMRNYMLICTGLL